MRKTKIDLPDEEVNIRIAKCGNCGNIVFVAVEHLMNKAAYKEMEKCIKNGCNVDTMKLLEYRKLSNIEWCNSKCNQTNKK